MTTPEKKEKLHKILDLILDINGLEQRKQELTGDKPTTFLRYSGHTNTIDIDLYKNGWNREENSDHVNIVAYIDEEFTHYPTLDEVIEKLELLKNKTNQTMAECSQCSQEGVKEDMLETVEGYTCEDCMKG